MPDNHDSERADGRDRRQDSTVAWVADSECSRLIRDFDWASTSLGPRGTWDNALCVLLGMILNSTQAMCVVWGADRTLLYNDRFARMLEHRHPAALGRNFVEMWGEERYEGVAERVGRAFGGEAAVAEDLPINKKSVLGRSNEYFTVSYTPVRGKQGSVAGLLLLYIDVTERRRAELELRESQDHLEHTIALNPQVQFSANAQGMIVTYSERWVQRTGVRPEDTPSGYWHSITHSDDISRLMAAWQASVVSGQPFDAEIRFREADRSYRWWRVRAFPRRDGAGEIVKWYGTAEDIHVQRTAVDNLGKALRRTNEILEGLTDGFFVVDAHWQVTHVNRAALAMWNRRRGELLGNVFVEAFPQVMGTDYWGLLQRGLLEQATNRFEVRCPVMGKWIRANTHPVLNSGGMSVYFRDITAERSVDERQRFMAREVDHRAKNVLAVVQAIVRLTKTEDHAGFVRAVEGRVGALVRAQTLLSAVKWKGGDVRDLLRGELAPFLGEGGGQAHLRGPDILLPPNATQPMGMAIHELATNAIKHGSLSVPGGEVSVQWGTDDEASGGFWLRWSERGGPAIPEPRRTGFGSRVLESTVRTQLRGEISTLWRPEGLLCEISIPLQAAAAAPAATP